jgi:hypothetical protein
MALTVELTGEHSAAGAVDFARRTGRLRQISCGQRDGVATVGELSADFSP